MKIAIHALEDSFSDIWISYCKEHSIPFKLVNCYRTDIIQQVQDCDALMWHHQGTSFKDVLAAKNILFSLEHTGLKVFPSFHNNWHFDDKVAQMYLLQSIKAPLVPSYVFYDKESALNWIGKIEFPLVFKLKKGDASKNVRLLKSRAEAKRVIKRAFGKGFSPFNRIGHLKERYRKYKVGDDSLLGVLKGIRRVFYPPLYARMLGREKGYVYFQEFMPNNLFDIRLVVIEDKAYGMKRVVREGDFRASGSGRFIYDKLDVNVVKIAFEVAQKLKMQTVAFDFIYNRLGQPLIVEMSYGFGTTGSNKCTGYWSSDLKWQEVIIQPEVWMMENLIKSLKKRRR